MKYQVFNDSFLFFSESPNVWGILVDPTNQWKQIQEFVKKNEIQIRYILLTRATFKNAFRVAQIKQETGATFLSFQADLLKLRQLPTLADHVNVCGIKVPHVDRFLDGLDKIELDGISLQIKTSGDVHEYVIDNGPAV